MRVAPPINDSVGKRGRNHRHDVLVVQMLLNNHIAAIGPRARLSVDGCCGSHTLGAILEYQRRELHETEPHGVIYPHSRTLRRLLEVASVKQVELVRQVHKVQKLQKPTEYPVANVDEIAPLPPVAAKVAQSDEPPPKDTGAKTHLYTDSPLEMVKKATVVNPQQLPKLLQAAWPALNTDGARILTAQYMGETTGGKHCWNYNLGNVKCNHPDKELHQYLGATWEVYPTAVAATKLKTNKNARYATPAEIKAKVGKEAAGMKVVFFKPPDRTTCFAAYKTLDAGVVAWTDRYKRLAARNADFLRALNGNDVNGVARILRSVGYYTQSESAYARSMTDRKNELDRVLGANR